MQKKTAGRRLLKRYGLLNHMFVFVFSFYYSELSGIPMKPSTDGTEKLVQPSRVTVYQLQSQRGTCIGKQQMSSHCEKVDAFV